MENEIKAVRNYDQSTKDKMIPEKIQLDYQRPAFLDIFAQESIIISKRSTCLWFEVGAIIIANGRYNISSGHNGAVAGDVNPRDVGCSRVVDGRLQKGKGLCRGSHAEINAIGNLTMPTMNITDLTIMVTIHPCFSCAKQIVNKGIKKVYYIWNYSDEDEETAQFLEEKGVRVEKYSSTFLEKWINTNNYQPPPSAKQKTQQ